jgi:Mg-chelatase subunit ChlD
MIKNLLRKLLVSTVCAASLAAPFVADALAETKPRAERVEVVFVLDTTGSMGDLIEGAKRKIWSIANTIVDHNPDAEISMALIAYRDLGDDYVVKTEPMSEDLQGLYGKLVRLDADGGGDGPESVNAALLKAVSGLQWSSGDEVKRIVFLVGDAPPHMDYPQEKQYPEIVEDAVARGIVVNAVQAGGDPETTEIWKEIAQFGRGRFISIPQDGGEVVITVTPFDDDILHQQGMLDDTVIPYGKQTEREAIKQKMDDRAAAPKPEQVDNSTFYAKRSKKEAVTGGGDLVGDARNGTASAIEDIPVEDLPENLQRMTPAERSQEVARQTTKRKEIESKIQDLVEKRDLYIAEQRSKKVDASPQDSFDKAIEETLRVQLN